MANRVWMGMLSLLAFLASAHAGFAEDFVVADRSLRIEATPGWCSLGSMASPDGPLIRQWSQLGTGHILTVFVECEQLAALRQRRPGVFPNIGVIMVPRWEGEIAALPYTNRADFIEAAARQFQPMMMAPLADAMHEAGRRAGIGDLGDVKLAGVTKDDLGAYLSFRLPSLSVLKGKSLLISVATTMINRLPVAIVLVQPGEETWMVNRVVASERAILGG